MESRFITKNIYIYIFFFGCVSLSENETCLALEWTGHNLSLFFVAQSDLCLGNGAV